MHLLLLLPAKTTPPAAVPTLLAGRDHSSRDCISSCCLFIIYFNLIHSQELALVFSIKLFFRGIARCCRQRLLLLPPPCKWSRFGNEWRRHKSRRRRLGQANRQLAFCITRSLSRYTSLLLGSCWVGMLASRSGGPTLLHPTP